VNLEITWGWGISLESSHTEDGSNWETEIIEGDEVTEETSSATNLTSLKVGNCDEFV